MADQIKARQYIPQFAKQYGLTMTSFMGGKHNHGSLHPLGRAFDFDHKNVSDAKIAEIRKVVGLLGGRLLDERTRPKGQQVWGGPHWHAEFPQVVNLGLLGQVPSAPTQSQQVASSQAPLAAPLPPVKENQITYSLIDGKPFNLLGDENLGDFYRKKLPQPPVFERVASESPSVAQDSGNAPLVGSGQNNTGDKTMPFWAALGAFLKPVAQAGLTTALTGAPSGGAPQAGGGGGLLQAAIPKLEKKDKSQSVVPVPPIQPTQPLMGMGPMGMTQAPFMPFMYQQPGFLGRVLGG